MLKKLLINSRFKYRVLKQQLETNTPIVEIGNSLCRRTEGLNFNQSHKYEKQTYETLCLDIAKSDLSCVSFSDVFLNILPVEVRRRGCFVLRHDIDSGFIEETALMLKIEQKLNVCSTVHLFVDDVIYPKEIFKKVVKRFSSNTHFGLHTSKWCTSQKPIDDIIEECRLFEQTFGFQPDSISLHGLVPRPKISFLHRRNLINKWNAEIFRLNYPPIQTSFAWTCQDSGLGQSRSLPLVCYDRIVNSSHPGCVGNVLIHDTYWR